MFVVLAKESTKTRLDHWTGPLDWTTGLDYWTRLMKKNLIHRMRKVWHTKVRRAHLRGIDLWVCSLLTDAMRLEFRITSM